MASKIKEFNQLTKSFWMKKVKLDLKSTKPQRLKLPLSRHKKKDQELDNRGNKDFRTLSTGEDDKNQIKSQAFKPSKPFEIVIKNHDRAGMVRVNAEPMPLNLVPKQ